MSFQIALDPFDKAFAHFSRQIRAAIQKTFNEEAQNGLTQRELSETLGVNESVISRRLNGPGNITLRTLCDLFTAMGRDPLANFLVPEVKIVEANTMCSAPVTLEMKFANSLKNTATTDGFCSTERMFVKSYAI
jgi:hypothetical protein